MNDLIMEDWEWFLERMGTHHEHQKWMLEFDFCQLELDKYLFERDHEQIWFDHPRRRVKCMDG